MCFQLPFWRKEGSETFHLRKGDSNGWWIEDYKPKPLFTKELFKMKSSTKAIWGNILSGLAAAIITGFVMIVVANKETAEQAKAAQSAENQLTIIQNNYDEQTNVKTELERELSEIKKKLALLEVENANLKAKLASVGDGVLDDSASRSSETLVNDSSKGDTLKLSDLKITESRYYQHSEDSLKEDTVGNKYTSNNLFTIHAQGVDGYGYATYYTGRKYSKLSGVVAVSDESEVRDDVSLKGWVGVYIKKGDEYELVDSTNELSRETSTVGFDNIDISEAEWLQIRYYNQSEYFNLAQGYHSLEVLLSDFQLYPV